MISYDEMLKDCEKFNISLDSLIRDFKILAKSCFRWKGCEHSLDELKKTPYYRYFLERALTLKILKEYKKCHNANDMCESEVKQKIEMIKQGKLPPIPSVDNQSTKGLVTSDTYDSEAKRIIKCVEEGKLPPIFDEEHK